MRDGSDQGTKGCWVGGVISVGRVVPEAMRRCFAGCLEAGPAGWAIPPSAPGTPCVSQMPSAFPESRGRPAVVLAREIAFHRLQAPGPD